MEIAPSLERRFSDPGLSSNIKAFAFGLVAFYVTEGKWRRGYNAVVDFLCDVFAGQKQSDLELQYLQSFKLILRYTAEDPREESRQPARKKIMKTVAQRASLGLGDSTLKEEYRRILGNMGMSDSRRRISKWFGTGNGSLLLHARALRPGEHSKAVCYI